MVFSADRVRSPGSQIKTRAPADTKVVKVDDHTVDFVLTSPNPILHYEWDTWYIMSKKWAEANGAAQAQPGVRDLAQPVALNANGTGPFMIESHQPGVKTVFKPNPNWWGKPEHNLTEVIFQTIKSDATRVAALLSGEVDMMDPVPVQDIERVKASPNATVLIGPELRTIFLDFDQFRDELKYSNVKGKNPFKDVRVRKAFYQAIDIEAITDKVMRGMSAPSALMISPLLFSRAGEFKRHPYDADGRQEAARRGRLSAGLRGRRWTARTTATSTTRRSARRWPHAVAHRHQGEAQRAAEGQVLRQGRSDQKYDTSFYLLGWTPGSFDSWNMLANIIGCREPTARARAFNLGGYCNPKIDELTSRSWSRSTPRSATS